MNPPAGSILLVSDVHAHYQVIDAQLAHARDELGIFEMTTARPLEAALASAATFAVGAALPLVVFALVPRTNALVGVAGASLVFLTALGIMAARAGGASPLTGAIRVASWGALAMGITTLAGRIFGAPA